MRAGGASRAGGARAPLALALIAAWAIGASAAPGHVRGVRPDLASKYEPGPGGKWSCLDGSRELDFTQVNDDFCHCPDGSDEPGTSACPNGVFYCRNRGHEPKVMSTAFVDDGVCDCCDGSDELEGCTNTCIEKNAAVREGLKQKVEDYKKALSKRHEYAAGAAARRKEMQERLGAIDGDIAAAEEEVKRAQAERTKLQDNAEERKAAREEKHRVEAAARAEERKAAREARAAARAKEAAEAKAKAQAAEEKPAEGAPAEGEQEETAEERGRRIAAQWTNDPAAAGAPKAVPEGEKQEEKPAEPQADGAKEEPAAGAEGGGWLSSTWSKIKGALSKGAAQDEDAGADANWDWDANTCEEPTCYDSDAPKDDEEDPPEPPYVDRDTELDAATTAVTTAEERVTSLRGEKEVLQRQVTYDYGADDAWIALTKHCAEAREPQYTYRLCLFDKAAQVDNNAGHETNLGQWRGFEKGYTEGVFENGDWCHQAPARSMRVTFQCGLEESAWGGSEPATCAYAAAMATPAACRQEDLQALEDRLAALIKEEAELAKEIAEEEAARQAAFRAHAAAAAAKDEL